MFFKINGTQTHKFEILLQLIRLLQLIILRACEQFCHNIGSGFYDIALIIGPI